MTTTSLPPRLSLMAPLARRTAGVVAVVANCLVAGTPFTFPLFAPPLARALALTGKQTNALASTAVLAQ